MFLLPIIAAYSSYNLATTHSNKYEASGGDRKINCYDIWEKIVTGPGTGSIAEGQAAANRLKGGYQDRLTTIDNLSKEMDAAWTGKSAEAAKESGAHPLRIWMEDSGKKLTDSDKYLGEQSNAFTTVKAKVQEVPKEPPKNNLLNSITPWTTDTDRAIRDYNRNGQANVDAFNEYFKASSENGKKLPTYNKMEGQKSAIDVSGGGNGKDKDGNGDRNPNTGMPPGSMPPGSMPNMPGSNMPGANMPGANMPGSNMPGANMPGTHLPNMPGSNMPGANMPGGQFNPNIPGSDYKPPSWNDGTSASGFTPPKIPGAGGFGPGGGGGGGGASFGGVDIPGAGGFGPDGGFGPGGGGGFGPGSGAAIPGSGAAGAGASGAGGGMGAGGAGRAGMGAPMGGMGGMGAGGAKGKGAEDEERSAKFLVGDDPNDIFGTDELTAPPVIGE